MLERSASKVKIQPQAEFLFRTRAPWGDEPRDTYKEKDLRRLK
jgi:hypothetical protein